MDYRYWSEKLTEDEFEEWEVEMLMYHAFHNEDDEFLSDRFHNFKNFIGNSFDWTETKKGSNYWYRLSREER
jgi:hypothetical protein